MMLSTAEQVQSPVLVVPVLRVLVRASTVRVLIVTLTKSETYKETIKEKVQYEYSYEQEVRVPYPTVLYSRPL